MQLFILKNIRRPQLANGTFNLSRKIKIGALALLGLTAAIGIAACNKTGGAASSYELATDIPVGSKDAKVVMVEYASITCPHCARFEKDVMPTILKNYVETGKVRYVFREFPTPPIELASAGHLLGRCVAPDKRQALIETLMAQQVEIYTQAQAGNALQPFMTIAASVGMNEDAFKACMQDKDKLQILVDVQDYGQNHDKVTGTPSVFVNGKLVTGPVGREFNVQDISAALDAELAKTTAK